MMKPPITIAAPSRPESKAPPSDAEPIDDQRVLWLAVRRGLLTIVKAIEVKYELNNDDKGKRAA